MNHFDLEKCVEELNPWEGKRDYFLYREFICELSYRAPNIPKPIVKKSVEGNPEFIWTDGMTKLFKEVQIELYPIKGDRVFLGYTLIKHNDDSYEGAWDRSNNYFDCWVIRGLVDEYEEKEGAFLFPWPPALPYPTISEA
jgi:hypothetical protein